MSWWHLGEVVQPVLIFITPCSYNTKTEKLTVCGCRLCLQRMFRATLLSVDYSHSEMLWREEGGGGLKISVALIIRLVIWKTIAFLVYRYRIRTMMERAADTSHTIYSYVANWTNMPPTPLDSSTAYLPPSPSPRSIFWVEPWSSMSHYEDPCQ